MPNSPSPPRRTALVVDDFQDTADLLAELLDACGFDTSIAHDGEQAIQMANLLHPDLVLLDIGLPKGSGLEVCSRIRHELWGAGARIVAVTGQDLSTMRQPLIDAGFDEILAKPCSFRDISGVLEAQKH